MIADVADECVEVLRWADIAAEVVFVPTLELPDTIERRVIVTPAAIEGVPGTRGQDQEDQTIHIGVIARVGTRCRDDDVREQLAFVVELRDLFKRHRLPVSRAVLVSFANAPVYHENFLRDDGLFVSVLRLVFREFR